MRQQNSEPTNDSGVASIWAMGAMNWEAVGAVSAALSVVVVLVSILYLASQVRQSNLQAQGAAHSDWFTGWNDIIRGGSPMIGPSQ